MGENGEKQILTGMAKWYSPEQMTGMKTLFVSNLEPRKMMGLTSEGMMLSIGEDPDEKPYLIDLSTNDAENGTPIS